MNIAEIEFSFPTAHAGNVFGQFDTNMKKIEKTLHVTLIFRDDKLKLIGTEKDCKRAKDVVDELLLLSERGNVISEQDVNYALSLSMTDAVSTMTSLDSEIICHTVMGKPVKPKTKGQQEYVKLIDDKMIVFGVGPAGTGKTYLAMAKAITAFKANDVSRIILTRPAIEAGEKLGFLPGDLQSKVDPYLRPLYDALYEMMGAETFQKNMEKGLIEVAPLAYMRGRTLDNAYVVLDEAQNTTPAQMKMFLTRIGFGSKAIITGDMTQKDLPEGARSGLDDALRVLKNIEEIGVCMLTSEDVVRHPLVQKIVSAYEEDEQRREKKAQKKRMDNNRYYREDSYHRNGRNNDNRNRRDSLRADRRRNG